MQTFIYNILMASVTMGKFVDLSKIIFKILFGFYRENTGSQWGDAFKLYVFKLENNSFFASLSFCGTRILDALRRVGTDGAHGCFKALVECLFGIGFKCRLSFFLLL